MGPPFYWTESGFRKESGRSAARCTKSGSVTLDPIAAAPDAQMRELVHDFAVPEARADRRCTPARAIASLNRPPDGRSGRGERAGRAAFSGRRLPLAQAAPPPIRAAPRHRSSGRRRSCHLPAQAEHAGARVREIVHGIARRPPWPKGRGALGQTELRPSRGRVRGKRYQPPVRRAPGSKRSAVPSLLEQAPAPPEF